MDDTDFYLKVSETFSEIMRQVRFYPYPAVLYKIAFNKFLNGETPQPSAAPLKRGAQKEKEVEKKEEKADSPSVASDSSPSREQNFSPDRGSPRFIGGGG
jgi:hypothetical protein